VTSTNIPGLTGGLSYTFTVAATNSQGTGLGASSAPVVIQGPPQAPALNSLTPGYVSGTVGTLTAAWTAPSNNGGSSITGYTITTSPAITPVSVGVVTSRTLTAAEGLARCTTYTVMVAANNVWGTGAESNALAALDAVVPGAIGSAPTNTPDSGQIALFWNAPATNGCSIDSYRINASGPTGTGGIAAITDTGTSLTSYNFMGLTTCNYTLTGTTPPTAQTCFTRTWTFTVQAHNAVGFGPASSATGALRPLVGYSGDSVYLIWANNPGQVCTSCHRLSNPLHLDGTINPGATTYNCNFPTTSTQCSYRSIINKSPSIIAGSPVSNSYLLSCPLADTVNCPYTSMTSLNPHAFLNNGVPEYVVIQQWLNDGAKF